MSSASAVPGTQPSIFLSHGGGPMFFMDPTGSDMAEMCKGSAAVRTYYLIQTIPNYSHGQSSC